MLKPVIGGLVEIPTAKHLGASMGNNFGELVNGVTTDMVQAAVFDDANIIDTETGYFTVPTTGRYMFIASPYFVGLSPSDIYQIQLWKADNSFAVTLIRDVAAYASDYSESGMAVLQCNAGDVFVFRAMVNTTGSDEGARQLYSYFTIQKV